MTNILIHTNVGRYGVLPWIAPILIGPGLIVDDYNGTGLFYGVFHTILIILLLINGYIGAGTVGALASWVLLGYVLAWIYDP